MCKISEWSRCSDLQGDCDPCFLEQLMKPRAEWEQLIEPNLSQCFLISRSSFLLNTWETVSAVADFSFFIFARHNIQQSPRNEGIAPHQHHRLFLAQSKILIYKHRSTNRLVRHSWASWSRKQLSEPLQGIRTRLYAFGLSMRSA